MGGGVAGSASLLDKRCFNLTSGENVLTKVPLVSAKGSEVKLELK